MEETALLRTVSIVSETADETDLVSSRFLQEFTIKNVLGCGGFGIVFEVEKKMDEQLYAVKCIKLPKREHARLKVIREVKSLAKLERPGHPGIVKYYNAWEESPPGWWYKTTFKDILSSMDESYTDDVSSYVDLGNNRSNWSNTDQDDRVFLLFIQMELCKKETLRQWLDELEPRSPQDALTYFYQIVVAIKYIHQMGMMHRDLKPANIFFSSDDGAIKVGDFGLAKVVDEEDWGACSSHHDTNHTAWVGTASYLSPEQKDKQVYDSKVDVFSLGLIFLELIIPMQSAMERHKVFQKARHQDLASHLSGIKLDLAEQMLLPNPSTRANIDGILDHYLFSGFTSPYGASSYDFKPVFKEKPLFAMNIWYGLNKNFEVQNTTFGLHGCKLLLESEAEVLPKFLFDSENEAKINVLPSLSTYQGTKYINKKQQLLIHRLLENMNKGINFTVKEGSLYAERFCMTQVFLTDLKSKSQKLERSEKILILDINKTCEPSIHLTFGKEIEKNNDVPLRRVVIYAQIDCIALKEKLAEFNPQSTGSSMEPCISNEDKGSSKN